MPCLSIKDQFGFQLHYVFLKNINLYLAIKRNVNFNLSKLINQRNTLKDNKNYSN